MSRPIFIVGSPRSGTTLLRMMLDAHPNISCGPETFFLVDLKKILTEYWPVLQGFALDRQYWVDHLARFFSDFQEDYARRRGKSRWAEKTPVYTRHVEFINELFPDAQFLHIVRDPTGVIASHRDRWGYKSAIRAAFAWPHYVRSVRTFGETVGSDRYFEFTYEGLVAKPEEVAKQILAFLGEPWDPIVLAYDTTDHDVSGKFKEYTEMRRREAGSQSTIYTTRALKQGARLDPILRFLARRSSRRAAES